MKLVKSLLVAMLLGIMAIQVAWAEGDNSNKERLWMEFLKLLDAAEKGNLDDVKLHLSRGADINGEYVKHGETETALTLAMYRGHFDIAKYLIEKGADVNIWGTKYEYTALMEATKCSNRLLMSFGREHLNVYECKRDDKKCLKEKYSTCLKMVKYLVEKGADVNAKNKNGETALMIASSDGKLEIIKYLISKSADINATDKNGKNALMSHLRGYPEDLEIVKALVGGKGGFLSLFKKSNGVDVNAKDNEGKTALMYARNLEVVKYLLSKGADINAKDNKGKSVFDYTDSGEMAEFLLSKGAKR